MNGKELRTSSHFQILTKIEFQDLSSNLQIALHTDPKNRTSHGRPPARLRQTLTFVLMIREEKRPKTG